MDQTVIDAALETYPAGQARATRATRAARAAHLRELSGASVGRARRRR